MIIQSSRFIISSPDYKKCPPGTVPEFAFIGRSNVGKSSLINMLCGVKDLAKTSSKPGKTQLINHFSINQDQWYLVDLPGYGYAKIAKSQRERFATMITQYILQRDSLMNVFVLIDSRLEPQAKDLDFIDWLGNNRVPFSIVFTKADKISQAKVQANKSLFEQTLLETWESLPPVLLSSSTDGRGKKELLDHIDEILKSQV